MGSAMNWWQEALVEHPEIAVFLVLAVGFWCGKFTFKGLGLGSVTATLVAGVIIGAVVSVHLEDGSTARVVVSHGAIEMFFLAFLFALGFRLGPQFFAGLRGAGAPQALFAVTVIAVGIMTSILISAALGYNPGLAAGLTAGGLTQSSIVGISQDAIGGLPENSDTLDEWNNLVLVGFAVTYIFGTLGSAIYCANVAPRLLGIQDLKAAAKATEAQLGLGDEQFDDATADHSVEHPAFAPPEVMVPATGEESGQSGEQERSSTATDFITVGLGTAAGALLGIPSVTVGNLPLALTPSVGALLLGLLIGWWRARSASPDRNPAGVQWFFETVGLTVFVAMIGINAGPGFVDGMRDFGVGLLFAGALVTLAPLIAGTLLARYVFKFDAVVSLGMLAGAQTMSAAAGSVQEAADSNVPLLGYTVPYAVGNVFLSIGGAIVVAVLA